MFRLVFVVAFSNNVYVVRVEIPVWLSGLIWGIMLITAVYGYEALEYLNYVAIPALIIICGRPCYGY